MKCVVFKYIIFLSLILILAEAEAIKNESCLTIGKIQDYEEQLEKQKKLIDQQAQEIFELKNEIYNSTNDCTHFGDAPGIHKIIIKDSFDALCDSATAGPGWTVIQQRINGKEDFNRDWATYRNGFGDFEADFFLGLEKIHRLTSAQPHELYVHMEDFDGIIKYYRYENFAIAGEVYQYRLNILGKAEGNATNDELNYHNDQKFSTYDRDNDNWKYNCAEKYGGGSWFKSCARSNLNGKYYNAKVDIRNGIYWDGMVSLKTVKMLIRAKSY